MRQFNYGHFGHFWTFLLKPPQSFIGLFFIFHVNLPDVRSNVFKIQTYLNWEALCSQTYLKWETVCLQYLAKPSRSYSFPNDKLSNFLGCTCSFMFSITCWHENSSPDHQTDFDWNLFTTCGIQMKNEFDLQV